MGRNRKRQAVGTAWYRKFDDNCYTIHDGRKTIIYAYDPTGNRSHMDAPDAGRFTYSYDGVGQITELHNGFDELKFRNFRGRLLRLFETRILYRKNGV
jgi:hypothetical protein